MYDVHLGLNIGKRVVDFLLVLIELYSLGVRLSRTGEYRLRSQIADFTPTRSV